MRSTTVALLIAASIFMIGCQGIVDEWQGLKVWVVNSTSEERLMALSYTTHPENQAAMYAIPADGRLHQLYFVSLGSMEAPDLSGWLFVYDSACHEVAREELEPGAYLVNITPRNLEVDLLDTAATRPAADYLDGTERTCAP